MKKVLFVCLGNICRSPMAEAMLRHIAKGDIITDSAATSRYQIGKPPHPGTQEVLTDLGISFEGMAARQITEADFYDFDLIIGMDQSNINDLLSIAPKGMESKVSMLIEGLDVPDPYYTGDFEETKKLLSESIEKLYDTIKASN